MVSCFVGSTHSFVVFAVNIGPMKISGLDFAAVEEEQTKTA